MKQKVRALLRSHNFWLAMVCLIGGAFAYLLARHQLQVREQQVSTRLAQQYVLEGRVVAARALAAGDLLTAGSLALRQVPVQFARADSLPAAEAATLLGRRVRHALRAGDMLGPADVDQDLSAGLAQALAAGQRAITLEVDPVNGLDGQLRPGDRVDLYHLRSPRTGDASLALLLQAAQVLATGQQTVADAGNSNGEGIGFNTVTLLLTPDDAARVLLAQRTGQLFTALRHPDDGQQVQLKVRDARQLLATAPGMPRSPRSTPALQVISGGGRVATVQQSLLPPGQP